MKHLKKFDQYIKEELDWKKLTEPVVKAAKKAAEFLGIKARRPDPNQKEFSTVGTLGDKEQKFVKTGKFELIDFDPSFNKTLTRGDGGRTPQEQWDYWHTLCSVPVINKDGKIKFEELEDKETGEIYWSILCWDGDDFHGVFRDYNKPCWKLTEDELNNIDQHIWCFKEANYPKIKKQFQNYNTMPANEIQPINSVMWTYASIY